MTTMKEIEVKALGQEVEAVAARTKDENPLPQMHFAGDADEQAAINLGAAVLARIEDPAAREIAIRNALTMASQAPSPNTRSDLYDADAFMADGGDTPMTAAENVLAWLLVEKIGVPDDVGYSPNQAQEIIVRRLEQVRELEQIEDMLDEGQGDDQGHQIMPEFTKGMTTYAKVEACLHLLERRRDALHPSPPSPSPVDSRELIERLVKALGAAETYVIDGVTTAKQNLEINAAYPARKPRYEAELQEARDIYSECQAARRAALAAAKEANRG